MRTLGYSFSVFKDLVNIVHDVWLEVPMISTPFLDIELRMFWIINYGGSWMKRMSKFLLISNRVLVRSLLLQKFYKKVWRTWKLYFYLAYSWVNWVSSDFSEFL